MARREGPSTLACCVIILEKGDPVVRPVRKAAGAVRYGKPKDTRKTAGPVAEGMHDSQRSEAGLTR